MMVQTRGTGGDGCLVRFYWLPGRNEQRPVMGRSGYRQLAGLAIIGLALAWGLPAAGLSRFLFPGDSLAAHLGREGVWWMIGAVMLLWVARAERLPFSSVGLKPPTLATFGWGLLFVVPMVASVIVSFAVIFPMFGLHQNMATTHALIAVPLWLQLATMVRAGVVEEMLFRGYSIERLTMLCNRRWVAAVLSASVFVAIHLSSWGFATLIVVAFGAVFLTGLYLWRRDLVSCMIAHAVTDMIGFGLARLHR